MDVFEFLKDKMSYFASNSARLIISGECTLQRNMRLLRNTESIRVGSYKLPDICGNCILQPPTGHELIYPPNLMSPSRAPLPPIKASNLVTAQDKRQFIAHWAELNKSSPRINNSKSPPTNDKIRQQSKQRLKQHKETIKPSEAQVFQISVKTGLEALTHNVPHETHRKLGHMTSTKLKPIPPTPVSCSWSRYLPNGAYTGPLTRYTTTNQRRLEELQKPRPCSIHMPKVDYLMYDEDGYYETSSIDDDTPHGGGRMCDVINEEGSAHSCHINMEGRDSISQARPPSLIPDTDDWLDRHKRRHSIDDRMQRVQEWLFE